MNKKHIGLIVGLIIIITRFFFFDGTPDYFDATQYLWRTNSGTLLDAISTGHGPYHPGYLFISFLIHNFFQLFHIDNLEVATTFPAVIFGSLALWFFYLLSLRMTKNYLAAAVATICATLAPYLWLGSISILIDPVMWGGYIMGLYFWFRYLETKKICYSFGAGLGLAWAMFAHTQVGIWAIAYIAFFLIYTKPKQYLITAIKALPFIIPIIGVISAYVFLLLHTHHDDSIQSALNYLLLGNAGDHGPFALIPALRMMAIHISIIGLLMGGLSFIYVWAKKPQLALVLTGWLLPGAIMAPAYLYANLYGRALAIGTFPVFIAIGFTFAKLYQNKNKRYQYLACGLAVLLFAQLIAISLPWAWKMKTDISPYRELQYDLNKLPQPGLQITNNAAKTYDDYNHEMVVWEMPREKIDSTINDNISKNQPIFYGLEAILYPYFKYDGVFWDISSTNFGNFGGHEPYGKWLFNRFNFDIAYWSKKGYKSGQYIVSEQDKPIGERILNSAKNIPQDQTMVAVQLFNKNQPIKSSLIDIYSTQKSVSAQRINKNDWLWWKFNKIQDPLIFSLTDKSGLMQVAIPAKEAQELSFYATTYPNVLIDNDVKFYPNETKKIITNFTSDEGDEMKIINAIKAYENKNFAIIINKNNNYYQWSIGEIQLENPFNLDSAIYFKSLSRQIGKEDNGIVIASANDGAGFISFGPWMELPKGKYKAKVKIKTNQDTSFEISANGPKVLTSNNINTNNEWKEVELNWQTTENSGGVEFRTTHIPGTEVSLDNIKLEYNK